MRGLKIILLGLVMSTMTGCISMKSIARISDLPVSVESVDFSKVDNSQYGVFEDVFTLNSVSMEKAFSATKQALDDEGFDIVSLDEGMGFVIAQRGLRLNEWATVAGVYLKMQQDDLQVKVIARISQDYTGGWDESYAADISEKIREFAAKSTVQ